MSVTRQLAVYWDRQAPAFDALYSGRKNDVSRLWDRLTRQNIRQRFDFTMRAVAPVNGKRILDVGCGPGWYCCALAERGAEQVVGLDLAPQMLSLAQRLAKQRGVQERCQFFCSDILAYRQSQPFDDVVVMGFFDYAPQPEQVMSRLRLLTAGQLIASFPCRRAFRVPFRKVWLNTRGCYVRFYSRMDVESLCLETGFAIKTLIRQGPIYLLIAEPT
jgi:2-polyprenyl-3-methyl-5-hydroxy-6-metoxy-1,4-benzoquinol methylase